MLKKYLIARMFAIDTTKSNTNTKGKKQGDVIKHKMEQKTSWKRVKIQCLHTLLSFWVLPVHWKSVGGIRRMVISWRSVYYFKENCGKNDSRPWKLISYALDVRSLAASSEVFSCTLWWVQGKASFVAELRIHDQQRINNVKISR